MSSPREDALRELRRAWRADAPLPRALETGALEDCDVATRASVEWLCAAHRARARRQAPARVPLALQLAHARARRRSSARSIRRSASLLGGLAAAASVLLLARALVVNAPPVAAPLSGAPAGPTDVADVGPRESEQPPSRITDVPPERFRSRDDGIELVSGNVRLVLLATTTPNPDRGERR